MAYHLIMADGKPPNGLYKAAKDCEHNPLGLEDKEPPILADWL